MTMRDVFFNRLYELAKKDERIVVVSADMGAPSLDKFKKDFPHRYISTGIAEQNAILVASGLAKLGFLPYVYAIAPFITLRCYEQIRVNQGMMKLPIVIVGVGGGFGYEDSGPTHHLLEDIAVMKAIPNMRIYIPSCNKEAKYCAEYMDSGYIRLDREGCEEIPLEWSANKPDKDVKRSIIFTTGIMWKVARDVCQELEDLDLTYYVVRQIENNVCDRVENIEGNVFTVEEGFQGGLYSSIKEIYPHAINLGINSNQGYCYAYGGREEIRKYYGIDKESIKQKILSYTDAVNDSC